MVLTRSQLYVVATACLVYFSQGYVHAIFNGLITMDSFVSQFPETDTRGPAAVRAWRSLMQGTIVAILDVGSTLGSVFCAVLGDRLGRRRLVLTSVVVAIIGAIVQTSAFAYPQLVVGRIISGAGLGSFSATVPMWLAECLEAKSRGRITVFTGVFVTVGFVVASWVDFGFYAQQSCAISWRIPLALQLVPLLAIVWFCLKSTESPRWLVRQESISEATIALSALRGCSTDDKTVLVEIVAIQESADKETSSTASSRTAWRAFLAVWLCILVTLSGANVISFFSTEILQDQLKFDPKMARLLSCGLQLVQLVYALVGCLLVDRLGRRATMIASAAIMALAMGLLSHESGRAASVASQFLVMVCYPIGFHSTPYMYCAEIAPLVSRSAIAAGSSAFHWVLNFVVAEVTPTAFGTLGRRYYLVYMAFNLCALVCLLLLYPETRGFNLERIDDIFTCSKNPIKMVAASKAAAASKADPQLEGPVVEVEKIGWGAGGLKEV